MEMADEVSFQVAYEGEALDAGSMDVRELAPALLSLSDLIDHANEELHGEESEVSLQIENTGKGSFEVELILWAQQAQPVINALNSPAMDGLVNLLKVLGFAGGAISAAYGLFQMIVDRGGQEPEEVRPSTEPGQVLIIWPDGTEMVVDADTYRLFRSPEVRGSARGVVKPLKQPGITAFRAGQDNNESVRVENTDVTRFEDYEEQPSLIEEQETERLFAIDDISFKPGNKWRLSDGSNSFYVTMSDSGFVRDVQEGNERFGKKDNLRVKLVTKQYREPDGSLKTEQEVLEVIEHIRPGQTDLFKGSMEEGLPEVGDEDGPAQLPPPDDE